MSYSAPTLGGDRTAPIQVIQRCSNLCVVLTMDTEGSMSEPQGCYAGDDREGGTVAVRPNHVWMYTRSLRDVTTYRCVNCGVKWKWPHPLEAK